MKTISNVFNYDRNRFSKKFKLITEQKIKETENQLKDTRNAINDIQHVINGLSSEMKQLDAQNVDFNIKLRELQIAARTEQNSSTSTDILTAIETLKTSIKDNRNEYRVKIMARSKKSNELYKLLEIEKKQKNEIKKLNSDISNTEIKKKAAIFVQNNLISSQKRKDENSFMDLHKIQKQLRTDYEDLNEESTQNENLSTLFDVFESISKNIQNGFANNWFIYGDSQQNYQIIDNVLEIKLNLEIGLDNHDTIVKIRLKKPGQNTRSIIRMLYSKKHEDVIIIERVNLIDKDFPVSCYLYLSFVL